MGKGELKSGMGHCLLILGMHRSGTSALTGALHKLGLQLGNELLEPLDGVNPKGFWEHAKATALNEGILNELGSYWADVSELPKNPWKDSEQQAFKDALLALIRSEFTQGLYWGFKDPRLCRLLPLWQTVLQEHRITSSVLIILRNPMEVARSLFVRDGIGQTHALLLWARYVLDSEKHSRGIERMVVTYDELLGDWRGTMHRIKDVLRIPLEIEMNRTAVDEFLDSDLRHHNAPALPQDEAGKLAINIYKDITSGIFGNMKEYEIQLNELVRTHHPWIEEINHLNQQLRLSTTQNSCLQENAELLKAEISRLKSTYSWRVTRPLRWLWGVYSKKQQEAIR